MGAKRKTPVSIRIEEEVNTEVSHNDRLPQLKPYIDITYVKGSGVKQVTRWFLMKPTEIAINESTQIQKSSGGNFVVIGAKLLHHSNNNASTPLVEWCQSKGLSEQFSINIARILIHYLYGRELSTSTIKNIAYSITKFIEFIAQKVVDNRINASEYTPSSIDKETWVEYLNINPEKIAFNNIKNIFTSHTTTNINGWLSQLKYRQNKTLEKEEQASELDGTRDYSDSVMLQLLMLLTESFTRRIEYLKHYENLSEADMPIEWEKPNSEPRYFNTGVGLKRGERTYTPEGENIYKWLNDEGDGYQILINHHLMHYKYGAFISKNSKYLNLQKRLMNSSGELHSLAMKFYRTMGEWHGYDFPKSPTSLTKFYINKQTSSESNLEINQIGWCLANLIMMQTGINKEVALSIPSRTKNNQSILSRQNTLFIKSSGESNEIELIGYKDKTGTAKRKEITIRIVKNTPIHEMLIEYERHVKLDFNGPFFEFNNTFINKWNTAGKKEGFRNLYPIINDEGENLNSIDTPRFRKVFASSKLIDFLKSVKSANELARKLKEAHDHDSFNTTFNNYLMKSGASRGVMDIAIATITSSKLEEGLKFKGQFETDTEAPKLKKVFLCKCADPTSPTHQVAIADECKHYDLCLGCEQSIVSKEHLPFICYRILQYEEERRKDPTIWSATFENRWLIAQDCLEKYAIKDKRNGKELIDKAWHAARTGLISLAPIIMSGRL